MKEHWCEEYRQLQRNLSKAQEERDHPFGRSFATGYGGWCDNEDFVDGVANPFTGATITNDDCKRLFQTVVDLIIQIRIHRKSCQSCIIHFGEKL